MLFTILARMSNDEQRFQLLQTLRYKLSNYNLDWLDIRNIINLFTNKTTIRFDVFIFILSHRKDFLKQIEIDDYIYLSNQCTNDNENLKLRLFEQIYDKICIENRDDVQRLIDLFQTINMKQKIEIIFRKYRNDIFLNKQQESNNQFASALEINSDRQLTKVTHVLLPMSTLSSNEQLSTATLKRKYSFDNEYQDNVCQKIITPSLIIEKDELIQQREILPTISNCSSNSSLSNDEYIPKRTRSFMTAIKNTFERLKETSN